MDCFSPGPVPQQRIINIEYSHRGEQFKQLYLDTLTYLENWTGYNALIAQGSSSCAIETVLSSIKVKSLGILNYGVFGKRAIQIAEQYNHVEEVNTLEELTELVLKRVVDSIYIVQFETSNSSLIWMDELSPLLKICKENQVISIIDSVSAFPYYSLPDSDVIVLSSAKQLRGLPVVGIILHRKDLEDETSYLGKSLSLNINSYLSLRKLLEYKKRQQTPHTPMVPQILSLYESISKEEWKPYVKAINKNAGMLSFWFPDIIVGLNDAPVITLEVKDIKGLEQFLNEKQIQLYYNDSYMKKTAQVSCFNYFDIAVYQRLTKYLMEARQRGLL